MIRVWREPGVVGFRGRVTYVVDVSQAGETVVTVDGPELVHATVREWLEEFLPGSDPYALCQIVDRRQDRPQP